MPSTFIISENVRKLCISCIVVVLSLSSSSCIKGKGFLKQQAGTAELPGNTFIVESTSDGGVTTATMSATSQVVQRIAAGTDSELKDQFADFPPGSLSVNASISMSKGEDMEEAAAALAAGNEILASATPVSIMVDPVIDATTPFTLSLPKPNTTGLLNSTNENVAVAYSVQKQDSAGKSFVGLLPPSAVVIDGDKVVIKTLYFGTYQAVAFKEEVKEVKEVQGKVEDVVPADSVAPQVSSIKSRSILTAALRTLVDVTFSEDVQNFQNSGVLVDGGIVKSITASSAKEYIVEIENITAGTVTVSLLQGAASDAAGNQSLASSVITYGFDNVGPKIQLVCLNTAAVITDTSVTFTLTSDESLQGFEASDITVSSGSVSNLTGSGSSYTFVVTGFSLGNLTATLNATSVSDALGNKNTQTPYATVATDAPSPTVALTSGVAAGSSFSGTVPLTITFSEVVTGVDVGDFTVTNGAISGLTGSGTTYTATLAGSSDGSVSVVFVGSAVTSARGKTNSPSNTMTFVRDTSGPTITLTGPTPGTFNDATISVTGILSEAVSNFTAADIYISGGTISGFSYAGTTFSFNVVSMAEGSVNINIPASMMIDAAGNGNTASNALALTYDLTAPTTAALTTSGPTASSLTLNWSPASDVVTSSSSLIYEVFKSNTNNISNIATTRANGGAPLTTANNITSYTITGLNENQTYYFSVIVTDLAGNEGFFTSIPGTTADVTPPNAPNYFQAEYRGATKVEFYWQPGSAADEAVILKREGAIVGSGSLPDNTLSVGQSVNSDTVVYVGPANAGYASFNTASANTITNYRIMIRDSSWNDSTPADSKVVFHSRYKKVVTMANAACGLRSNGSVLCWGANDTGQLGDGTTVARLVPTIISGYTFVDIAAGANHACGIDGEGAVHCWGKNDFGQVGTGSNSPAQHPSPQPVDNTFRFVSIASGGDTTCAIRTNGAVMCWGKGTQGQIGNGAPSNAFSPTAVQTGSLETAKKIAVGVSHACAIAGNGTLYCWGTEVFGELGNGNTTTDNSSSPVQLSTPGVKFRDISLANDHSCAVSTAGDLYCWGNRANYKLGDGNNAAGERLVPTAIPLTTLPANLQKIRKVSVGANNSCVINAAGKTYCWGNDINNLGYATGSPEPTPNSINHSVLKVDQTFKDIAVSAGFSCAITGDGLLYCWGSNTAQGNLGMNSSSVSSVQTPTLIHPSVAAPSGHDFIDVATGNFHSCGLSIAGRGFCWGDNSSGQLGLGLSSVTEVNPKAVVTHGFAGSHSQTFSKVSTAALSTCGLAGDGFIYCWGDNSAGRLGNNAVSGSTVPYKINLPNSVSDMRYIDVNTSDAMACAISVEGKVYCWGDNLAGQLGDGSTSIKNIPTLVSTGSDLYTKVEPGVFHSCGVRDDGVAHCWGSNSSYELGNNTLIDSLTPTPVSVSTFAGRSFIDITAGLTISCGLTDQRSLICWGTEVYGELGNSSGSNDASPLADGATPTINAVRAFSHITSSHVCVIRGDNTTNTYAALGSCWGENTWGALGDNTTVDQIAPVDLASASTNNYTAIASGLWHSCGLLTDGSIHCWGLSDDGQTTHGSNINVSTVINNY